MYKTSVLINLIKSVITGAAVAETPVEQLAQVFALAQRHDVMPIVAQALYQLEDSVPEKTRETCKSQLFSAVMRYERMQHEYHQTCAVLEAAAVDFLPLKGAVLRDRYPEPWMRTSCDIDILVKDIDRAAAALAEKGYENLGKGSHDIAFRSPGGTCVELHFQLIETDKRIDGVLQQVWDYAQPKEPGAHYYLLRDDMFYFYHIAHMAKHFSMAGCGVRFFVDTWLLNAGEHDAAARAALLEKGGLSAFEDNARKLSFAWLGDGTMEPLLEQMENFVLSGGTLGSDTNQIHVNKAKSAGKTGFLLYRIFMPYHSMRLKYPVLKNWPVLLPLYWIRRWIELLLSGGKREHALQEMKMNQQIDAQTIKSVRWMLEELDLY